MNSLLSNIEWGSVADWLSGILTFVSVSFAFYLNLHRKKPNLNFELVNWPYPHNYSNGEIKNINSYLLLVQNEENYPLNIKVISNSEYSNWNNKIIHLPAISSNNSKPAFLEVPLKFSENNQAKFTFQNMANKKKTKVTVTKLNNKVSFYRGFKGINQGVNTNLKAGSIEKIEN